MPFSKRFKIKQDLVKPTCLSNDPCKDKEGEDKLKCFKEQGECGKQPFAGLIGWLSRDINIDTITNEWNNMSQPTNPKTGTFIMPWSTGKELTKKSDIVAVGGFSSAPLDFPKAAEFKTNYPNNEKWLVIGGDCVGGNTINNQRTPACSRTTMTVDCIVNDSNIDKIVDLINTLDAKGLFVDVEGCLLQYLETNTGQTKTISDLNDFIGKIKAQLPVDFKYIYGVSQTLGAGIGNDHTPTIDNGDLNKNNLSNFTHVAPFLYWGGNSYEIYPDLKDGLANCKITKSCLKEDCSYPALCGTKSQINWLGDPEYCTDDANIPLDISPKLSACAPTRSIYRWIYQTINAGWDPSEIYLTYSGPATENDGNKPTILETLAKVAKGGLQASVEPSPSTPTPSPLTPTPTPTPSPFTPTPTPTPSPFTPTPTPTPSPFTPNPTPSGCNNCDQSNPCLFNSQCLPKTSGSCLPGTHDCTH